MGSGESYRGRMPLGRGRQSGLGAVFLGEKSSAAASSGPVKANTFRLYNDPSQTRVNDDSVGRRFDQHHTGLLRGHNLNER